MPTLEWIGKDKVINHHQDVPYRVLERIYSYDENGQHDEDNGSENMIIRGDNLEALKALLPKYEGRVKCIYIDPPYNTGFSKDKDCLPMWNYYTKNPSSIGYNLVFNSGDLVSSIFPRDSFYFVPHICCVLYKPKSQYRVISKILSSYYDLWKNNIKSRHNIISRRRPSIATR